MRASLASSTSCGCSTSERPQLRAATLPVRAQRPRSVAVRAMLPPCPQLNTLADSIPDPVLRSAVKEPVAFWGGVFAGVLGLNVEEEPLRSWVARTSGQQVKSSDSSSNSSSSPPQ